MNAQDTLASLKRVAINGPYVQADLADLLESARKQALEIRVYTAALPFTGVVIGAFFGGIMLEVRSSTLPEFDARWSGPEVRVMLLPISSISGFEVLGKSEHRSLPEEPHDPSGA